jgi:hypothetical protein
MDTDLYLGGPKTCDNTTHLKIRVGDGGKMDGGKMYGVKVDG